MEPPVPVWTGSAPPLAGGFIARPQVSHLLQTALVPGATVTLVPERSAAGPRSWRDCSGKTQLAGWYARELWQAGAVDLVIWLPATGRAQVLSGYVEAAAALGVRLSGDAESVSARFLRWLRDSPRQWLVVIDDLTDAAAMAGLWPQGPSGQVLVTTPDPAMSAGTVSGSTVSGSTVSGSTVSVGAFTRHEALSYLVGRLTADLDQRQGALDLVGDLGREPLALALASAVITSSELTCHDYRELFLRRRERLLTAASATTTTAVADPASSAVAWALSVEHADLLSPGTAHSLLVLAALLDGGGIPGAVFATSAVRQYAAVDGAVPDGLAALEHAGLLTADAASVPPVSRMSWPVQAAVRSAMPPAMLKGAVTAAADALLEAWPAKDPPQWLARPLRSCAESLRRSAGDLLWDGSCHALLMRAGASLDTARLVGPAVTYWEELAVTSARTLGHDHPATLGISERLAHAYLAAGRAPESIALLERIRGDRARMAGPDHPGYVQAGRDLGRALVTAKRFSEAVAVLTDVASGWERSAGADSLEAISAREDLAAALSAGGHFSDAITLYQRVLKDRERIQGSRHRDATATSRRLAQTYLTAGQARRGTR